MRLLKNFFAAFIALIAISATIASYAGAFSSTKLAPPNPGCYETVNVTNTINHSSQICGDITDFCALSATNPGTCEGAELACCYVVSSTLCDNEQGRLVTSIRCGEFEADAQ